jgi:hypothetical protein
VLGENLRAGAPDANWSTDPRTTCCSSRRPMRFWLAASDILLCAAVTSFSAFPADWEIWLIVWLKVAALCLIGCRSRRPSPALRRRRCQLQRPCGQSTGGSTPAVGSRPSGRAAGCVDHVEHPIASSGLARRPRRRCCMRFVPVAEHRSRRSARSSMSASLGGMFIIAQLASASRSRSGLLGFRLAPAAGGASFFGGSYPTMQAARIDAARLQLSDSGLPST